ncbi:MAG: hypothetical protein K8I82_05130 [Anaerolineae bacterium]|nr:hypothetical protein [Anaerolineae bacterium]
MLVPTLAEYIGIPEIEIQQFMTMPKSQLYKNDVYQALVESLDYQMLGTTLTEARSVYDTHLPELVDYLRQEYGFKGKPMTALTLGNWLLGFLHNHKNLHKLAEMHHHIPHYVLEYGLPEILKILNFMPDPARAEWQKAMAVLSLPLFAQA